MLRAGRRIRHPKLRRAAEFLDRNQPNDAERILAGYLEKVPDDTIALDLMAESALQMGRTEIAEPLLARCMNDAAALPIARYHYAKTLYHRNKPLPALAQLEQLLCTDSRNPLYLELQSIILTGLGRHQEALACRRQLTEDHPQSTEIWIKYGLALKIMGRRDDAIAAFRRAIALCPSCGEAWWNVASSGGFQFAPEEFVAMQEQLARPEVAGEDRMYLHYAMGKAHGDRKHYAKSFENYARANAIKRLSIEYDPNWLTRNVANCKALFTREFFHSRAGMGCDSTGPIFIVGLQRAGSTLLEQIFASHSAIEGTSELPDVTLLAEHIGANIAPNYNATYPDVLAKLDDATLRELGARYLETTRFRRSAGRAFFTDKMPYNFLHIALIHLMLPNAKIIDIRRHPLACGFSNFSLHYKFGALFAYRLAELGCAYADYVELMAHFDAVLPGRVHRVFYEDLVRQPEVEIRRLLEHVGVPFEESCLRFHENTRAMDSVSSEQVRRPIFSESIDQWRNYEPWLGPLKTALGPVLQAYPDVPEFAAPRRAEAECVPA